MSPSNRFEFSSFFIKPSFSKSISCKFLVSKSSGDKIVSILLSVVLIIWENENWNKIYWFRTFFVNFHLLNQFDFAKNQKIHAKKHQNKIELHRVKFKLLKSVYFAVQTVLLVKYIVNCKIPCEWKSFFRKKTFF